MVSKRDPWTPALCLTLFAACAIYSLVGASIGWNNSLIGTHGFRQAQTALSTYTMLEGGPWLAYETPVLGAPWRIPFEFPLYQWLVALAVTLTGMPLDQAGRLVGAVLFFATAIPAYALLGSLGVRPAHRLLFLALLLVSPQYIFWSRAFMIESTALFCSVSYLALGARALDGGRLPALVATAVFGVLAATVKLTTFVPFLLAAMLYLALRRRRMAAAGRSAPGFFPWMAAAAAVPLAGAAAWIMFTDSWKAQNPLAADFITSAALTEWNFGTLEQRLSVRSGYTLWSRTLADIAGSGWIVVAAALLAFAARRRLGLFLACFALFLSAPMIFTNLHLIHNYYACANGVFLIAAVGCSAVGCLERGGAWRWLGVALLLAAIGVSDWRYRSLYVPLQTAPPNRVLDVARIVESVTAPDDVLLILGLDWSSELPYSAKRRSLMNRAGILPDRPRMQQALANLGEHPPAAMVACGPALANRPLIQSWVVALGLDAVPRTTSVCAVYTRGKS
jgi:hypothetical protein